ncbi:D-Ala-D-Ala carboxypeptidase family metallohydrolase [Microbulbifer sp. OS29]|uniref:D-Ala-D-Ala carboxypeptidase family metallohydrolase n=1 Tax=Microbulbifer okhotskensis TaxID=2926617 RepID=A0A9X2ENB9_9GAMM|nr:D-Ala-D-Ala carboxypeptidase family metallohydrolase [Microbulbifer okhotskensis]MCO1332733.1 D-Ala-D-Ala carboxypeptidase family metallohydrolase [Microbulbifer okhotskensis]
MFKQRNTEFVEISRQNLRRQILIIGAIVLAILLGFFIFTFERVRDLDDRVRSPINILPLLMIPEVYDIQGYPAASERAFSRFLSKGNNHARFTKLKKFLRNNRVDQVVPPFELLRQGSDWQDLDEPPFAIPPKELWWGMVNTLRVIEREIVPRIGPITVVSGWRTVGYNRKAGGSKGSKHLHFCGLDMVPQQKFSRDQLIPVLRDIHKRNGLQWQMGLGIYRSVRFHVDTCGYRRW